MQPHVWKYKEHFELAERHEQKSYIVAVIDSYHDAIYYYTITSSLMVFSVASMAFAACIFSGILSGTKMVDAMAGTFVQGIPTSLGPNPSTNTALSSTIKSAFGIIMVMLDFALPKGPASKLIRKSEGIKMNTQRNMLWMYTNKDKYWNLDSDSCLFSSLSSTQLLNDSPPAC